MNFWITSDNHFGHKKIMDFCGRSEGFEYIILKNIGEVVKTGDIIINLGDFAWSEKGFWTKMYFGFTTGCKNWLVKGNHDEDSIQTLLNRGWDMVADTLEFVYKNKRILFSHKPQYDNGYDVNVHGHFHNIAEQKWKTLEPHLFDTKNNKQYLICLENNNYVLENLDDIITKVTNV